MTTVSVRLPDSLLQETDRIASEMHLARAEYLRLALEAMNKRVCREKAAQRMIEVSRRVRQESMKVNAEFDAVEVDPGA